MTERDRARVAYHGAVTLLVSVVCGVIAVTEPVGLGMPSWQKAHGAFVLMGVWLLAAGGVLPSLSLERQNADALVVSLIGTAYAFMTAVLIQTVLGVRIVGPGGPFTHWVAFVANLVVALCGFVSSALILMGAHAALKRPEPASARAELVPGD